MPEAEAARPPQEGVGHQHQAQAPEHRGIGGGTHPGAGLEGGAHLDQAPGHRSAVPGSRRASQGTSSRNTTSAGGQDQGAGGGEAGPVAR